MVNGDELLARLRGTDAKVLPRVATLIENEDRLGLAILDQLYAVTGGAHVVGITGPPGVGKSTLIAALLAPARASGRRVAVIAVDPSSTLTGGAVLGDRIRMMDRHDDTGVFVRSMASRGRQGGLAWATSELAHLLDAAGYPLILIETVGVGQDGTDIAALADTVVVVEAPGLGDGVQAVKSGLLEVGDVVVLNKADNPGTDEALRTLRATLNMSHAPGSRRVPLLPVVATGGTGATELLTAIDDHAAWLEANGERDGRRERRARAEVLSGMRAQLDRRLDARQSHATGLAEEIRRVARREISPRQAIAGLLGSSLLDAGSA